MTDIRLLLVLGVVTIAPVTIAPVSGSWAQPLTVHSAGPAADSASTTADSPSLPASWNQLSVWVGGAGANGALIGKIPRSSIGVMGVRFHHRLSPSPGDPSGGLTYTYVADVLPVVVLSVPSGVVPRTAIGRRVQFRSGVTTYGVGASPIGIRLNYRTDGRVEPYVAGSTGLLYFTEAWPDERGRRLNFSVDAGAGLQIGLTSSTILTLGYRYYHLSNGFRGEINPGIDAHFFHAGVTIVP